MSGEYVNAFKFLAPDPLSSAIIGVKGQGIQEMQLKTETRISISDRGDKYPNTNSRLVLIRGNSKEAIDAALSAVVDKIKSLVVSPKKPDVDLTDIVMKTGTDFRIKCVIPKLAVGGVIGPKGANVAELREQTACRVRVEDGKVGSGDTSEQVVSLLGPFGALASCAYRVNAIVQELASQPWFPEWAHLSANSKPQAIYNFGGSPVDPFRGGGFSAPDDEMVFRVMRSMPHQLVGSQTFAMQASLPIDAMSGLIGKGGCGTKEIHSQTGAKVTLKNEDPNTTVTIEGSLNSTLCAYMLVMKRYLELEHQQRSKGKGKGGKGKGMLQDVY